MGTTHAPLARRVALTVVAAISVACGRGTSEPIRVIDQSRGCFHHVEKSYAWEPDGRDFVRGEARIRGADVEALRALLLASQRESPDHLLARLGFSPEALAAHRAEILDVIAPATWRDAAGRPLPLPPDIEPLLSYERLVGPVRAHLLGGKNLSTTQQAFTVLLPGETPIRVHGEGLRPGMLPWTITSGTESCSSSDPAISAALRPLADPEGPCVGDLDGALYWTSGLWRDQELWGRLAGDELVQRLAERQAVAQPGWAEFDQRFVIKEARSGTINSQPESAFYVLAARRPQLVDSAWWWNPLEGHARTRTWTEFVRAFDAVAAAAERQRWLAAWKAAGPDRHVEAHIVGVTPRSELMLEELVEPGWRHAGFRGTPEIELVLRRGRTWCGTIYLASGDRRAFIETTQPGSGSHWFDELEVAFHPNGDPPTYGLVDATGGVTVRKMLPRVRGR